MFGINIVYFLVKGFYLGQYRTAILLVFLFFTSVLSAAPSADYFPRQRLRKLSLHLRGYEPSGDEFAALQGAKNTDIFFQDIAKEWTQSTAFKNHMADKLYDIIRFRVTRGDLYTEVMNSLTTNISATPQSGLGVSPQANPFEQVFMKALESGATWYDLLSTPEFVVETHSIKNLSKISNGMRRIQEATRTIENRYFSGLIHGESAPSPVDVLSMAIGLAPLPVLTREQLASLRPLRERDSNFYIDTQGGEHGGSSLIGDTLANIRFLFPEFARAPKSSDAGRISTSPLSRLSVRPETMKGNKKSFIILRKRDAPLFSNYSLKNIELHDRRQSGRVLPNNQSLRDIVVESPNIGEITYDNPSIRYAVEAARYSQLQESPAVLRLIVASLLRLIDEKYVDDRYKSKELLEKYLLPPPLIGDDELAEHIYGKFIGQNELGIIPRMAKSNLLQKGKREEVLTVLKLAFVLVTEIYKGPVYEPHIVLTYISQQHPEVILAWLDSGEYFGQTAMQQRLAAYYASDFFDFFDYAKETSGWISLEQGSVPTLISANKFHKRFDQTIYSRSAAFHRIYFCDEMLPNVSTGNDLTEAASKGFVFEPHKGEATEGVAAPDVELLHQKPGCRFCHQKIDSTQETINGQFSGSKIIRYQTLSGLIDSFTIKHPRQLTERAVSTQTFHRCQAKKFWQMFIGADVPITIERIDRLSAEFQSSRFDLSKVAEILVSQEEFYTDDWAHRSKHFGIVKQLFSRCYACHEYNKKKTAHIPPLNRFPFTMSGKVRNDDEREENIDTLSLILDATQSVHAGEEARMPPESAGWALSLEELNLINQWILDGAQTEQGKRLLRQEDSQALLSDMNAEMLLHLQTRRPKRPIFEWGWWRYLTGNSWSRTFAKKWPLTHKSCTEKIPIEGDVMWGYRNFSTGRHDTQTIGETIRNWLVECLPEMLKKDISAAVSTFKRLHGDSDRAEFYGYTTLSRYTLNIQVQKPLVELTWNELSLDAKEGWVRAMMKNILPGLDPDSSQGDKFIGELLSTSDAYYKQADQPKTIEDITYIIARAMVLSLYFVSY